MRLTDIPAGSFFICNAFGTKEVYLKLEQPWEAIRVRGNPPAGIAIVVRTHLHEENRVHSLSWWSDDVDAFTIISPEDV